MSKVIVQESFFKAATLSHPWLFRGHVARADANSGDVVGVYSSSGKFYGWGFYSAKSQIAVRIISFSEDPIGADFWRGKIARAIAYRKEVVKSADAFRLISSEGDQIPGLIADVYGDHLVIQTLCPGVDQLKSFLIDEIGAQMPIQCVIERNDAPVRLLEGLPQQSGVLKGEMRQELICHEGEIKFYVDPLKGQKTGAYLDQRENRRASQRYARGRVLDGFCYQGAFALHAAATAHEVLALDSSRDALDGAERNAELNQLRNISFQKAKVFDVLNDLQGKEVFDFINLDPPAFAKSKRDAVAAERAYFELNLRALGLLKPGGILMTSSCSYHMTEEMFLKVLQRAVAKGRRMCRILEKRTQAQDHPILVNLPESHYLKCIVLQML